MIFNCKDKILRSKIHNIEDYNSFHNTYRFSGYCGIFDIVIQMRVIFILPQIIYLKLRYWSCAYSSATLFCALLHPRNQCSLLQAQQMFHICKVFLNDCQVVAFSIPYWKLILYMKLRYFHSCKATKTMNYTKLVNVLLRAQR